MKPRIVATFSIIFRLKIHRWPSLQALTAIFQLTTFGQATTVEEKTYKPF
jgi:hypothetical protein